MRHHVYPGASNRLDAEPCTVGLDLSLRAAAACLIPSGWDGLDLSGIRMWRFGREIKHPTERDQVTRNAEIADAVVALCSQAYYAVGGLPSVHVEDYAYSASTAGSHRLAEMRGVVKDRLHAETGLLLEPVVASTARKTLLQKLPRADVKAWTIRNVRRIGRETAGWTDDEVDAFCVANCGRALRGLVHMSFPGQ